MSESDEWYVEMATLQSALARTRDRLKLAEAVVEAARELIDYNIYASELYFAKRDILRDAVSAYDAAKEGEK